MEVIYATYHTGDEREEAIIDQVEQLAIELGHAVMRSTVKVEFYEPAPEGSEMPSIQFASGAVAEGRELQVILENGRLREYLTQLAA